MKRVFFIKKIFLLLLLTVTGSYAGKAKVEWYVPLIAKSQDGLIDKHNVLGQMRGCSDSYDKNDLIELRPFSAPYLTLNFFHPKWNRGNGHFASDYHDVKRQRRDSWIFQIESDDTERHITFEWKEPVLIGPKGKRAYRRLNRLKKKMWLVDLKEKRVMKLYRKKGKKYYNFSMNGEEVRQFLWLIGKKPSPHFLKKYFFDFGMNRESTKSFSSGERISPPSPSFREFQAPGSGEVTPAVFPYGTIDSLKVQKESIHLLMAP